MSNQIQVVPPPRPRLPRLPLRALERPPRDYTEFLPAHLEILETPATPKMAFFVWTLCGLLAGALLWSCFARLDIFAEAQGRIQPSGRSKVVQPVDTGRVREIAVSNGSRVKAGDLLVALDPTESLADKDAASAELASLRSEIARRQAEIAAVQADVETATFTQPQDGVPRDIVERDGKLFRAEMDQYQAQRDSLNAQLQEKTARAERLRTSIDPRKRVIALMQERVKMRTTLESTQSGTRAAVIDATQALESEMRNLADDQGQSLENDAAMNSLRRRLDQAKQDFLAVQNQRLTDAERRRADVEQNLIKASVREQRTRLVAPIDGVVQQLAVTTVGQVVTVGQPLMVIVPSDAKLEVMALIENKDIGFVKVGQEAVIKVDSFPFTRYGTLSGTVKRISMEAIRSQEADAASDASTLARPTNASSLASTPNVQSLVYPVTIELTRSSLDVDQQTVPLLPGMTVTAEVQTGSRRVIQYVLAPVWEASSQAAHER